jgi:hypothetical protein
MGVGEIQGIVETPEDAVAAVVLLDQITRNIYRGDLAAKVRPSASTYRQAFAIDHQAYRDFDPKALSLAKLFLAKPFGFGDRSRCESRSSFSKDAGNRGAQNSNFIQSRVSTAAISSTCHVNTRLRRSPS